MDKVQLQRTQGLAFDPQIQRIQPARLSETEALQQSAEQFEALFLQLVLKNMRAANEAISGEDGMFSSSSSQLFRDMHDSQLAQTMAGRSQLGLAEQIVRQLEPLTQDGPENKLKSVAEPVADELYQQFSVPALQQPLLTPKRQGES